MATYYEVTAYHPAPKYDASLEPLTIRVSQRGSCMGGPVTVVYSADCELLGCGKDRPSPETAIQELLGTNGYRHVRGITEITSTESLDRQEPVRPVAETKPRGQVITVTTDVFQALLNAELLEPIPADETTSWVTWGKEHWHGVTVRIECTLIPGQRVRRGAPK